MPSIVDMGLGGVLNGQQSNFLNDPGVLLGMLSLRERQKARKSDEAYRQERAEVSDRQFERSAGQRDQQIGIQQATNTRAQSGFDRGVQQEDAAAGYFTSMADELGLFEHEDPTTGARMGVPEIRQRFEAMAPDDQRRAIGMRMEELRAESEQRQAMEAQMQSQQMLGGFQKQLMGAAELGDLDEPMAQMLAERMQGAVTGASGEKPYQVMEDFQQVRQQAMAQRVEADRRAQIAAGVQPQMLAATANNPMLHGQAAMLMDAYASGGITDDQFFDGLNTIQKTQAAAQKAAAGDMSGLLTQVYGYSPEQAAQINTALSSGAMDFSRLPQVPAPGTVTESDKMLLSELGQRTRAAEKIAAEKIGDSQINAARAAQDLYGREFERATGRKIPEAKESNEQRQSRLRQIRDDVISELGSGATEQEIVDEIKRRLTARGSG